MIERDILDNDRIKRQSNEILAQCIHHDVLTRKVGDTTYSVSVPFYQGFGSVQYDFIEYSLAAELLAPLEQILNNQNLLQQIEEGPLRLKAVSLNRQLEMIVDNLRKFHSPESCRLRGLMTGSEAEAQPSSGDKFFVPFPKINGVNKGFFTVIDVLVSMAHLLKTSKEPLEEERKIWGPVINKYIEPIPFKPSISSIVNSKVNDSLGPIVIRGQSTDLNISSSLEQIIAVAREKFCRAANPPMMTTRFKSEAEFNADLQRQLDESRALTEGNLSLEDIERLARGEPITLDRLPS
jgi:hypothetical protein